MTVDATDVPATGATTPSTSVDPPAPQPLGADGPGATGAARSAGDPPAGAPDGPIDPARAGTGTAGGTAEGAAMAGSPAAGRVGAAGSAAGPAAADPAGRAALAGAVPEELRQRLALALDVDDLVAAVRLARELQPWFATVKVGLELYSAAGPDAITSLSDLGFDVFCDLKLHDIPTTVGRAARVLGAVGARYLTIHAAGGVPMLRAGAEGLREGAASAELPAPVPLAVTVLTSEAEATSHTLQQRVTAGLDAGCGGLVCAAPDLAVVRELAPAACIVTPGVRAEGAPVDDQSRVATPQAALDAGSDILVIGRAVTRADDPAAAAHALLSDLRV